MRAPGGLWSSIVAGAAAHTGTGQGRLGGHLAELVTDLVAHLRTILAAEQIPAGQADRIINAVLAGAPHALGTPTAAALMVVDPKSPAAARLRDRFALAGAVELVDWDTYDEQARAALFGRCRCGRALGCRATWTLGEHGHLTGFTDVACPGGHTTAAP